MNAEHWTLFPLYSLKYDCLSYRLGVSTRLVAREQLLPLA